MHAQSTFALVLLGSVSLSHLFRPALWKRFMADLADRPPTGIMVLAILHGLPGAILLAFPRTETWPGIVLTALGVAWTVKALLYMTWPEFGARMVRRGLALSDAKWTFAGVVLLSLSLIAAWDAVA